MLDTSGTSGVNRRVSGELKEKLETSQLPNYLAGLFVIAVVAMTLGVFFLDRSAQTRLRQRTSQYEALLAEVSSGSLGEVAAKVAAAESAGKALLAADRNLSLWSKFFKLFQTTTTPGVRLTSLSVDEKRNLKVEGLANNYLTLAGYLATLRQQPDFDRVDLVTSSATESNGATNVTFSLSIVVAARAFQTGGDQ